MKNSKNLRIQPTYRIIEPATFKMGQSDVDDDSNMLVTESW